MAAGPIGHAVVTSVSNRVPARVAPQTRHKTLFPKLRTPANKAIPYLTPGIPRLTPVFCSIATGHQAPREPRTTIDGNEDATIRPGGPHDPDRRDRDRDGVRARSLAGADLGRWCKVLEPDSRPIACRDDAIRMCDTD